MVSPSGTGGTEPTGVSQRCLYFDAREAAMGQERFPRREEHERTGGQHGIRDTDDVGPDGETASDGQPSEDPQLKRVHENAQSPDVPHRNDTDIKDGGARHRQQ
jgi:hypothetical protein